MGISKEWGVETTHEHHNKASFAMQSGIFWCWFEDRKVKGYMHNIGHEKSEKNAGYTGLDSFFKYCLFKLL